VATKQKLPLADLGHVLTIDRDRSIDALQASSLALGSLPMQFKNRTNSRCCYTRFFADAIQRRVVYTTRHSATRRCQCLCHFLCKRQILPCLPSWCGGLGRARENEAQRKAGVFESSASSAWSLGLRLSRPSRRKPCAPRMPVPGELA